MKKRMQAIRWVMTLATVLVLALLAWQCLDIYLEGNRPSNLDENGVYRSAVFSVEIVEARLRPLLPLLAVYVLMTLGALIAQAAGQAERPVAVHSPEERLHLLKAHVQTIPDGALALERQRRGICMAAAGAILVCAVPCLVYLLNRAHFTSWDLEHVMGQMLLHVTPWVAAAFAVALAASFACGRSVQREIETLKGQEKKASPQMPAPRRIPLGVWRIGLCVAAIVFIVLGVMNGGLRDVLVKAVNICTECIGLG